MFHKTKCELKSGIIVLFVLCSKCGIFKINGRFLLACGFAVLLITSTACRLAKTSDKSVPGRELGEITRIAQGNDVGTKIQNINSRSDVDSVQNEGFPPALEQLLPMAKPCGWPCDGYISSAYGIRFHPVFRCKKFHRGIDIANASSTRIRIRCTAYGEVAFSGWIRGYGHVIIVKHGFGYETVYGHLSKKYVKKGDKVSSRQIIAEMGNSGAATGFHLHYEVCFNGKSINPEPYLFANFIGQDVLKC
ncbi:MAG: M23 family metallopeptidase [Endomicrobium sp.]|jgi:murein DD-endopeptidase MepM/ murein hydrolase activator NlpD|nr:M23 family metallopeptidase [Endomicrobium sp.]